MNKCGILISIGKEMWLNNCIIWLNDHIISESRLESCSAYRCEFEIISERKMGFCAVFSEFLPKQKNISVSLATAGCPKGEDFGSAKCCKYTATFGEYDKKEIIQ